MSCRGTGGDCHGEANYPEPFTSMIWRDNLVATQFHPEKSQADGLRLLQNFAVRAATAYREEWQGCLFRV